MIRGLYTAAAGMLAEQRRHDNLTNNIANLNTPGYKQDEAVLRAFPEVLLNSMSKGPDGFTVTSPIGTMHNGVFTEELIPHFTQGDLMETGNHLDFAIQDEKENDGRINPSFFAVLNAEGEVRYARNGSFTLDAMGRLVTGDGNLVLGTDNNPIQANPDGSVDPNFRIVQLNDIENVPLFAREGHGLYRYAGEQEDLIDRVEYNVNQGYVERSNVDPAQTTIDLMVAARAYEANQKVIQSYDRSLEKAVNEVGRV